MLKTISKLLILVITLILVGLSIWLYDPLPNHPLPNHPQTDALISAEKAYFAEIIRDEWGVPHILGKTDADTSFGIAYAHAEDDYQTIQNVIAATRGHLAQYKGISAAPTDYIVSLLNVWPILHSRYETDVPDKVKAIAKGYATGLNLYASTTWMIHGKG